MDENRDNLLVQEETTFSLPELSEMYARLEEQLASLDYRITNKNFGSKIYQSKQTIASKGRFIAGAVNDVVIMDGQHPTYRLWAGHEDPALAPFSVDKNGNMIATSLDLSAYLQVGGAAADVNAGATTVSGTKITANSISTAKLIAGEIIGFTVTGGTVRTSSSSTRVELNGSNNDIRIYSGGVIRALGYDAGWSFRNSSGTSIGDLYASGDSLLLSATGTSAGSVVMNSGTSGSVSLAVNSTTYFYASGSLGYNVSARSIIPSSSSYRLGDSGSYWHSVWATALVAGSGGLTCQGSAVIYSGYSLTMNDGSINISSGFMNLAQMSGTTADARGDSQNGSMYYRSTDGVIRVKLAGTWKTITAS